MWIFSGKSVGTHTDSVDFEAVGEVIPMDNEMEKKKEYLRSYRKTRAEEKAIRESIDELRLNKMSPSMGAQDGMPKGNGSSDLSGYAARLDELERKLLVKQKKALILMDGITDSIAEMEDATERTLLRLRYICGHTWEKIMEEMDYSWGQVHNIHRKALKNFRKTV